MIEILFLILKIIGIVLLVLLGLILIVLLIICFVPIRYLLQGNIQGTKESIRANARVTWLFRIIRVYLYLVEEQKLRYECYLFGFKLKSGELGTEELDEEGEELNSELKEELEEEEELEDILETVNSTASTKSAIEKGKESYLDNEEVDSTESTEYIDTTYEKELTRNKTVHQSPNSSVYDQIENEAENEEENKQGKFEKIFSKIRELCDKIKVFMDMKEQVVNFYYHPTHQKALQKLKYEGIYQLKKLKPRVFEATGIVGLASPDQTGYMAAGLSMLLPIYGEHIDIRPEFEEVRMDVQGKLGGKIVVYPFLVSAIRLFLNKDVRRSVSDAKKMRFTK